MAKNSGNAGAGIGIDAGPIPRNVGAREMGQPTNGSTSAAVTPYPPTSGTPGRGAMKTGKSDSSNAFGTPGSHGRK